MSQSFSAALLQLGFLRLALLGLALVNVLIPLTTLLIAGADADDGWFVIPTVICPVMAPIFVVVIFFDIVMSKVRAADAGPEDGGFFRFIVRLETSVIILTLLFWVPYFISRF